MNVLSAETCNDCVLRSETQTKVWGFGVTTMCTRCRRAFVFKMQGHRMTGKKGNHVREGLD